MIWVGIVLGSILVLIIVFVLCLLIPKLKIIIEYRNGETTVIVRGFFFKYNLSGKRLSKMAKKDGALQKGKKQQSKAKNTHEETAEGFFEKVEHVKNSLIEVKDVLVDVLGYLAPRAEISDISVKSRFGTGDAAKTGMICGAFWALSGNVYAFLCRFFNIEFPDIQLEPLFEQKYFEVEARGIIKIRLVHIITALMRSSKVYDKYKNIKGVD